MQGRRLPDNHRGGLQHGDYMKRGGVWIARPPESDAGHLIDHEVTEHEDGTITVSPSILTDVWHGYLERGVWRKV
jgi:hypothetical protein